MIKVTMNKILVYGNISDVIFLKFCVSEFVISYRDVNDIFVYFCHGKILNPLYLLTWTLMV
jgi:hypothetical protein